MVLNQPKSTAKSLPWHRSVDRNRTVHLLVQMSFRSEVAAPPRRGLCNADSSLRKDKQPFLFETMTRYNFFRYLFIVRTGTSIKARIKIQGQGTFEYFYLVTEHFGNITKLGCCCFLFCDTG